jgi:transcriptional regulator with XRE-family HTH domain
MPPKKKKQIVASHRTPSREIFAANLKRLRLAQGLTQVALAECSGYTVSYVSMLECGTRNPTLDTLDVLSRCLQTAAANLIIKE